MKGRAVKLRALDEKSCMKLYTYNGNNSKEGLTRRS